MTRAHRCFDCRAPHQYQIVLHNKLWERIGVGPSYRQQNKSGRFRSRDILCFSCIEKRLKRKLRMTDLMTCPVNATWIMRIWLRRLPEHWRPEENAVLNADYDELLQLFVAPSAGPVRQNG